MTISAIFDRILDILFAVAGVILAIASLSVGAMVFSRYFFNEPLGWIIEVNEYILLHLAFLTPAWVLRNEGHVKMDIVFDMLGPKTQLVLNIFASIMGAVVCLVLTWFALVVTLGLYKAKTITPTLLELPKWPLVIVIVLGSFLFMIQYLRRTVGFLKASRGPTDPMNLPDDGLKEGVIPKNRVAI